MKLEHFYEQQPGDAWGIARDIWNSNNPPFTGKRPMRFLVKVNIPVEAGNRAAKAGKLSTIIQSILAELIYLPKQEGM